MKRKRSGEKWVNARAQRAVRGRNWNPPRAGILRGFATLSRAFGIGGAQGARALTARV